MANAPVKKAVDRSVHSFRFDTVQFHAFPSVSPGAGVASTAIQGRLSLPVACKIPLVQAFFTAIQALDGGHSFNIAVGEGAYETGGIAATNGAVWTGTPNHDGTVTVTVAGHAVVYTEVSGDTSPTALMGHVATAVNNDATVGALVTATNTAGHLILTWNEKGPNGNGQTLSVATTDSGTVTFVVDAATFSGGVAGTAITTAPADQTDISGTPWPISTASPQLTGSALYATGYAAAGNALFAADQLFTATAGVGAPKYQPALAASTTGSGGTLRYLTSVPDAIFAAGSELTLRAITPAGVGSISNLVVSLLVLPVMPLQQQPANNQTWVAGVDF